MPNPKDNSDEKTEPDNTPIQELGIPKGTLELLLSSQVYTADDLAGYLRARRFQNIPGLGPERIGMLGDKLITHQRNREKSKKQS